MEEEVWVLRWHLMLSCRYHLKRERFLDGLDRLATFLSAIGGAAVFSQILAKSVATSDLGLYITAGIAIVSTLALAYGPAAKARRHAELARDYKLIESHLQEFGDAIDKEALKRLEGQTLRVEATEPGPLSALITQCHNELARAFNKPDAITPLRWYERPLKNIFDFDQLFVSTPPAKAAATMLPTEQQKSAS